MLATSLHWIVSSAYPGLQCGNWKLQIMSSRVDAIRWHLARVAESSKMGGSDLRAGHSESSQPESMNAWIIPRRIETPQSGRFDDRKIRHSQPDGTTVAQRVCDSQSTGVDGAGAAYRLPPAGSG